MLITTMINQISYSQTTLQTYTVYSVKLAVTKLIFFPYTLRRVCAYIFIYTPSFVVLQINLN